MKKKTNTVVAKKENSDREAGRRQAGHFVGQRQESIPSPTADRMLFPVIHGKIKNKVIDTLCFQGMSTKSIIALGAVQYLHDQEFMNNVKNYFGASSGGLLAFFLIIGYTPAEIISYVCSHGVLEKIKHFNIVAMMNGTGATSWSKLQETLEKMTIEKIGYLPTMKGLKDNFKKNLTVVTYNLTKDETVYINAESHPELPALVALRMTANLPFVFEKFQYQGNYFIDGGAGNNFPLSQAEKKGKRVLGLRVNNNKTKPDDQKQTFLQYIYKVLCLPIQEVEKNQINNRANSTVVIDILTPELITAFEFKFSNSAKMNLFSHGYTQMKNAFNVE